MSVTVHGDNVQGPGPTPEPGDPPAITVVSKINAYEETMEKKVQGIDLVGKIEDSKQSFRNEVERIEESELVTHPTETTPSPIVSDLGTKGTLYTPKDIILKRISGLKEEQHMSPLIFEAAQRDDYATCEMLITNGVDSDIPGPCGRRLCHVAAITGSVPLLEILLRRPKKVWSTCSQGKTPLDYAAFNGHLDAARLLVEDSSFKRKADITKPELVQCAIEWARLRGLIDLVDSLLEPVLQDLQEAQNKRLFRQAVCDDDVKEVQKLLKRDINYGDALFLACEIKSVLMVETLMESQSSFDYDTKTRKAVIFAAQEGLQELLFTMLCGKDSEIWYGHISHIAFCSALAANQINLCNYLISEYFLHNEKAAFRKAAKYGNLPLLEAFLKKWGKARLKGKLINDAFRIAVEYKNSLPVIKFLLQIGADVNTEDDLWGSTLQRAVSQGQLGIVRYLASEGGANLNAPGRLGGSGPLITAISVGDVSMFSFFFGLQTCLETQHGVWGNVLQTASLLGRLEIVKEILDSGTNIDAYLEPHDSALIMAIQAGHFEIAELLISRGADVNIVTSKYGIALHLAAAGGIEKIVKLLVQAGAIVDSEEGDLGTPLQAAAAEEHQLMVLFLLECGADVNAQGGCHGNALQAALAGGHTLLARLLLFSGARVAKNVK